MIVGTCVRNAKAYRHFVHKRRLWQAFAGGAKIVAGMKAQFVGACREGIALKQGRVAAAIVVGVHSLNQRQRAFAIDSIEIDPHTSARPAVGRVQHMCCQAAAIDCHADCHACSARIPGLPPSKRSRRAVSVHSWPSFATVIFG